MVIVVFIFALCSFSCFTI